MIPGVVAALLACLLWGAIFLIPRIVFEFTPLETVIARSMAYGLFSLILLFLGRGRKRPTMTVTLWLYALFLAVITNYVYYSAVVVSVRFATPALCALVVGVSPVLISAYGSLRQKDATLFSLVVSSFFILLGLLSIHFNELAAASWQLSQLIGLFAALIALASWSYYVIANRALLSGTPPKFHSSDWATLLGCASLCVSSSLLLVALSIGKIELLMPNIQEIIALTPIGQNFLLGSLFLGIFCSWVGAALWNYASARLSISLLGQLALFETLFGMLSYYLWEEQIPPPQEVVGAVLMLSGVVLFTAMNRGKHLPEAVSVKNNH